MALPAFHVTCAFAGVDGYEDTKPEIINGAVWSESPTSGTPSTNTVPNPGATGGAILRIDVAADSYVSIGPNPNPAVGPRYLVRADKCPYDIGAKPGDKIAWVAA